MKGKSHSLISLFTIASLSTTILVQPMSLVKAEEATEDAITQPIQGFMFTVTVLGENGKTLAGQKIMLYDITSGRVEYASGISDSSGKVIFNNLPLNHNFSVSINGIIQGYTVRSGEAGGQMASSFTIPGQGTGAPTYTTKPITITVVNQDGEVLANREVSLKDRNGNLIDSKRSDSMGNIVFTDKLLEGTFYNYYLNGSKIGEVIPGQSRYVYEDTSNAVKSGFTFIATILAEDGLTLSGKEVVLRDITDGPNGPTISATSNSDGQAIFEELSLSRNYSITVDGVVKGHTIRTSEAGSVMRASFFADGKGEKKPTYSKDSVTVVVLDENAEPISGQKVVLRNTLGQEMGNGISDNEGKVIFSQGLHDGTFYKISVNELENISEAMPGNERSIYLTSDQMISSDDSAKPEAPKVDEKNSEKADKIKKGAEKTSVSKQPEASAVDKQSASKETPTSAGEGHSISKETKTSKVDSKNSQKPLSQVSKKALPSTGEQSNSFMAWLGSACLALIAMIFLTKKKLQK